ncbi:hypothetical protein [Longitalea arenae]|uniref:hypothetical protein n=1 Tax=Longitalea arenae TaxID=2812558 RepID=UPI0019672E50|nr:hypothetical protein [Longitalea arenae]
MDKRDLKKDLNKDRQQLEEEKDNTVSQPDPETLHKTDPQENMKGPVSSLVNKAKDSAEENDEEDNRDKDE